MSASADQPAGLVDAQRLRVHAGELGGHRDHATPRLTRRRCLGLRLSRLPRSANSRRSRGLPSITFGSSSTACCCSLVSDRGRRSRSGSGCRPGRGRRLGGPSPRRRWTVPCWVPGGTRSLRPAERGDLDRRARIASGIVIGTSTSRLSPLRLNTGDGDTCVTTYRSPGAPPRRPASPFAARRTRLPSRTPAGMFTR